MRFLAYLPELAELLDFDSNGWNPNVDLFENPNEWIVLAEVPGVSKKDLKINLENGVLTLKGERKKDSSEDLWFKELDTGSFSRSFAFPSDIDPDMVQAELRDGILKVRVPKPEESKPKDIKVN